MDYSALVEPMQDYGDWLPAVTAFAHGVGIVIKNVPEHRDTDSINDPNVTMDQAGPSKRMPNTPTMPELTPHRRTIGVSPINESDESDSEDDFVPSLQCGDTVLSTRQTRQDTHSSKVVKPTPLNGDASDELDDSRDDENYQPSEDSSESEVDTTLNKSASAWTFNKGPRKQLSEMGMYRCIPHSDAHIEGMKTYMSVDLNIESTKHIDITASLVARFFYFIQGGPEKDPKILDPKALLSERDRAGKWREIYQNSDASANPILNMGKALSM